MKDCNQCGKCCIKYGGGDLAVTQDEIDLWEIFNPEIFDYVKNNEIWFDPNTGDKLTRCPFLSSPPLSSEPISSKELNSMPPESTPHLYTCSIYLDRPEDCRHYPSLIAEMIRDECEMIEVIDLNNPKKAQVTLDKIMADSRPQQA